MRILVYGLQSSGASLFTYWLSQTDDYIGVIDLYVGRKPPAKKDILKENVILKTTVSHLDLDECISVFQPDKTILFVRDPYQNYLSLKRKPFKNTGGNIQEKIKKFDSLFKKREKFDAVISYEDFIQDQDKVIQCLKSVGIPAEKDNYMFYKTPYDVLKYARDHSEYLAKTHKQRWDIGNIHRKNGEINLVKKTSPVGYFTRRKVNRWSPCIVEYYHEK